MAKDWLRAVGGEQERERASDNRELESETQVEREGEREREKARENMWPQRMALSETEALRWRGKQKYREIKTHGETGRSVVGTVERERRCERRTT